VNAVHFSSESVEWGTPAEVFDPLDERFGFELDVCASAENAKCLRYFTRQQDGLKQSWDGPCWMNPPYGNPEFPCKKRCTKKRCKKRGHHIAHYVPGIADWVKKARGEAITGATVVCLLPARTDTEWWWDLVLEPEGKLLGTGYQYPSTTWIRSDYLDVEITTIKGRIVFEGADSGAPFPSAVVVFRPGR
jgi:phage N-6-adenine-methyltransferase